MKIKVAGQFPRIAALFALFAGLAGVPVHAQTPFTTGGAEVRAFLARSITSVYAAAYGGGLYLSGNAGSSWARVNLTSSNPRYLTSIAGNNATYFVVGAAEGLFRTSDGTTFTQTLFEQVNAVAVAPGTSQVVLAGIKGLGIVRSTDAGVSFAPANNAALTSTDIASIAFDPSDATGNKVYLAAIPDGTGVKGGFYQSNDGGNSWTADTGIGTAGGNNYVSSVTVDGTGVIYAGVLQPSDGGGNVYSRPGGGSTWTPATVTIPQGTFPVFYGVVSLHRDANSSGTIWVGTRSLGVQNGNVSGWNYMFFQDGSPNIFYTGINAVATLPGSSVVLKAIRGAGVWRSTTAAANPANPRTDWTRVNFPGADRVLSASGVAGSPATMLAGLFAGGVWRSSNSGATFAPPTTGGVGTVPAGFAFGSSANSVDPIMSIWELSASATNPNLIYASAGGLGMFYFNNGVGTFRWNGTCWQGVGVGVPSSGNCAGASEANLPFGTAQVFGATVHPADDRIAYTSFMGVSFGEFARSVTGSWTSTVPASGLTHTPQMRGVYISASNASRVIALPFDDKPLLSTNTGASYVEASVSQTGFERLRFFQAAENPSNTAQWVAATSMGIYRSTDSGASWSRVAGGPFLTLAMPAIGYKPASGLAFAGDFDGNRYCSSDGGANWVVLSPPLRASVNAIRSIGGSLYYLTDGAGMFREDGSC